MTGFKHGPLPPAQLHPRYLASDNLRGPLREIEMPQSRPVRVVLVSCENCAWRGEISSYGQHRARAHAAPPRMIAPHARVEHAAAVAKGRHSAALRRERLKIAPAMLAAAPPPARLVEDTIRFCPDCVWSGPQSEYRDHREDAHRRR